LEQFDGFTKASALRRVAEQKDEMCDGPCVATLIALAIKE
jgi:hypothetical protein